MYVLNENSSSELADATDIRLQTVHTYLCHCRTCTWQERDRWIGLVTAQGCSCDGATDAECDTCRDSWTWLDGSAVDVVLFNGTEPADNTALCARITTAGAWAGLACDERLKSVCKTGRIINN